MIIYGTKTKQLARESVFEKCPNCGNQNTVEIYVFQKYAHIFWIPFFPLGKTMVSQCSHCKQVLKEKEMPASLKASNDQVKTLAKTPVWTFSGLALVAVLVTIGIISDKQKDARNARLVSEPKNGDIFKVKTKENQYTLFKVESTRGDSTYVRINEFETNKLSGLADLKRKGATAYSEELFGFSKSELKSMLDHGEIVEVERAE